MDHIKFGIIQKMKIMKLQKAVMYLRAMGYTVTNTACLPIDQRILFTGTVHPFWRIQ